MAWELKGRGHNAVPCGWQVNSPNPIGLLAAWADKIVIMQAGFRGHVPGTCRHKIMVCDVGPDRWVNPTHPELRQIVRDWIEKEGL